MKWSQLFEQPAFIPVFTDYSHFLGKCIGVTGRSGLLGGILSERLAAHNVNVEAYPDDITDITSLRAWFRKHRFDYFFHFGAIVPVNQVMDDPLKAYNVNVIGSYNICSQIIEAHRNCWLFLASSSHIYKCSPISGEPAIKVGSAEEPETFYGVTKLAAERICGPILDQYKVDYCRQSINVSHEGIAVEFPLKTGRCSIMRLREDNTKRNSYKMFYAEGEGIDTPNAFRGNSLEIKVEKDINTIRRYIFDFTKSK